MAIRESYEQVKTNLNEFNDKEITVSATKILLSIVGVLLFGLGVGWFLLGWWVAPVQWEPQSMSDMPEHSKDIVVETLSENYALTKDPARVDPYTYELYNLDEIACRVSEKKLEQDDMLGYARLVNIAYLVNGYGCK